MWIGRLAHLRSVGNGFPFLGPLVGTRKATISLELEWVRMGLPLGLLESVPVGTGVGVQPGCLADEGAQSCPFLLAASCIMAGTDTHVVKTR